MLRVAIVTFSPAGSTRKLGAMLASALEARGCAPELVDVTRNPAYFTAQDRTAALENLVGAHDVLCVGGPVYAHHMQFNVLDLVHRLPPVGGRWGRLAVPFVTYGGLTSGRALYETARALRRRGRRVALAMKVNAFHSVTREFATRINEGMPGEEARSLVDQLAGHIAQLRADSPPPDVTGCLDYQDAKNRLKDVLLFHERGVPALAMPRVRFIPDKCSSCGLCVRACPVQRLEMCPDGPARTRAAGACIHCSECVFACRRGAVRHSMKRFEKPILDGGRGRGLLPSHEMPRSAVYAVPRPFALGAGGGSSKTPNPTGLRETRLVNATGGQHMAGEATHPLFRLFRSEHFDNQAKRVLGHSVYHGALPGEVFSVLPRIRNGNFESWYRQWKAVAEQTVALAERAADSLSRGRALLRAANYFRSAMFFLPPRDGRTGEIYARSMRAFQRALRDLAIPHQIHFIDYGKGRMRAYYFPGTSDGPLFLVHGGFDSTNEEAYFLIVAPLIERGYPVLMFEGPGQSSMARDYDIPFTVDWHRPIGAVLDSVQRNLPEVATSRKVLVGISFGGLLAARAAAVERRLDGIVIFGSPFDTLDVALSMNPLLRLLYRTGRRNVLNRLVGLVMKFDDGVGWAIRNGMYTFGADTPYDMLRASARYTIRDVHEAIACDVLALRGNDDIYGPHQALLFTDAFPHARSYAFVEYARETGASEHCQIGSVEQAAQAIVSWVRAQALDRPVPAPAPSVAAIA